MTKAARCSTPDARSGGYGVYVTPKMLSMVTMSQQINKKDSIRKKTKKLNKKD